MTRSWILDACAMLALLKDEVGSELVENVLTDPTGRCYAHSFNLCEVFYQSYRNGGEKSARRAIDALDEAGVVERSDIDRDFWESIG